MAGWILAAPPAAAAAARLCRREGTSGVLMAEAFGPLLGLPAIAALGLAALARRRGLFALAGAVTGLHLAWLSSELRQAGPTDDGPEPVSGDADLTHLRLFSANVLFTNTDLDGIAAEIREADADVVILQEVSPPTLAGLERAGILARYPFRSLNARPDPLGTALLSRFALDEVESCVIPAMPMARATILAGGHRLRLYNVHTRAPFGPGGLALWEAQLKGLAHVVGNEPGPLIMAGDFNASSGHRPFRAVLAAGVRDAHMVRRRWWATTWPSDLRVSPPFARIDHVLVSPHLEVLGVSEGVGRGSDHHPVIADLAVKGRPRSVAPDTPQPAASPGRPPDHDVGRIRDITSR
ncbi:MAG: endonuclease/exonuclease/phosphatase family protein [Actinomycetota bacterium]|nr:endonuclease/exonuclease/phosphatase family protein [Actinomycetota bacterium]